jgi:hypothetical protein
LTVDSDITGKQKITSYGALSSASTLTTDDDITGKQKITSYGALSSASTLTVDSTITGKSGLTLTGDIAVNGGDVTTTSIGTATLFNTNATTLNVGGAATTVSIGASTGTTTINNPVAGKSTITAQTSLSSYGGVYHIGNPMGAVPVLIKVSGINFLGATNTTTKLYDVPQGFKFLPTEVCVIHDTVTFTGGVTNSVNVTDTMPTFRLVDGSSNNLFASSGWFAPTNGAGGYWSGGTIAQGSQDTYQNSAGPKYTVVSGGTVNFKILTGWVQSGITNITSWNSTVILRGILVAN